MRVCRVCAVGGEKFCTQLLSWCGDADPDSILTNMCSPLVLSVRVELGESRKTVLGIITNGTTADRMSF